MQTETVKTNPFQFDAEEYAEFESSLPAPSTQITPLFDSRTEGVKDEFLSPFRILKECQRFVCSGIPGLVVSLVDNDLSRWFVSWSCPNKHSERVVCLSFFMVIPKDYPFVPPSVHMVETRLPF